MPNQKFLKKDNRQVQKRQKKKLIKKLNLLKESWFLLIDSLEPKG